MHTYICNSAYLSTGSKQWELKKKNSFESICKQMGKFKLQALLRNKRVLKCLLIILNFLLNIRFKSTKNIY